MLKARGSLSLTGAAKDDAEMFMATVHGAMLSARAYGDAKAFGAIAHPLLERFTT